MSTLAACRADNFYQPPDYDPKNRQKEIERKRKLGTLKVRKGGARKIRFEMPFHVRCSACEHMIAKGVRFNAVKKKVGRYLGTQIFSFTMPCPSCKNTILIKTDPKSCEYLLVSGCVKYADDYDESKIDTHKMQTPEQGEALNKNPFLKLETQKIDYVKAQEKKPLLKLIYDKKTLMRHDFYVNQTLRRKLKMEKNVIKREENESKAKGLDIRLLPINHEDRYKASIAKFQIKNNIFNIRDKMRLEPIFKNNKFSSNSNKNNEIITLLNKKHKLDRSLQISLEKEKVNLNLENSKKIFTENCSHFSFSSTLKLSNNIIIKKKI